MAVIYRCGRNAGFISTLSRSRLMFTLEKYERQIVHTEDMCVTVLLKLPVVKFWPRRCAPFLTSTFRILFGKIRPNATLSPRVKTRLCLVVDRCSPAVPRLSIDTEYQSPG